MLAACGLDRLGLAGEIGMRLEPDVMLPEAGQGALAMQVRLGEEELVAVADDPETRRRVEAERRCVAAVGGGCLAPVAAHHDGVTLTALVAAEDGSWIERVAGRRPRGARPRARIARAMTLAAGPHARLSRAAPSHTRPTDGTDRGTPSPIPFRSPRAGGGLGRGRHRTVARVVVTRPAGQEGALVERLRALGHEVAHVPLVAVEPLGDDPIDVTAYDWVVLTSANGARELRRRMRGTPARVAAIGQATADAFGGADLVAETSTQEGLLDALPEAPGRVLFAAAEGARRLLPDALDADVVALYRTVELDPPDWPEADLVVLMSPSAARALARVTRDVPAVSIGPETTRAARDAGVTVATEAARSDLDGVVAAVEEALAAS